MHSNKVFIFFMLLTLLVLIPITFFRNHSYHFRKPASSSIPVTLLARSERRIYHTDLETYLIGVVAAEMPANFSLEALKAQAVAARTLTIGRLKRFGGRGCQHYDGVDLCDDPSENQAWLSVQTLKGKWRREEFGYLYRKVNQAVRDTAGIIMVYNDQPIDAVFHSTCGVGTADAMDVWQHQIPYLKSVSCGFDHHSPRYLNQVKFSWADLVKRLNIPKSALKEIKIIKRSNQGRVLLISIGGLRLTGEELRKMLNLTSTYITCTPSQDGITFNAIGYGHGVGMCQYGADGMAKQGWNYHRILSHFYPGIRFCNLK